MEESSTLYASYLGKQLFISALCFLSVSQFRICDKQLPQSHGDSDVMQ